MHDATMGNMLVCHGRRGDGLALVSPGQEGRRTGGREGDVGRAMLEFPRCRDTGFSPRGKFVIRITWYNFTCHHTKLDQIFNQQFYACVWTSLRNPVAATPTATVPFNQRRCRRRLKEFPTRLTCFGMWEERQRQEREEGREEAAPIPSVGRRSSEGSSVPRIELSLTLEIRASMNREEFLGLWVLR